MSKKNTPRRNDRQRTGDRPRRSRRPGSGGPSPATWRAALAKLVRGLGATDDPLEAERLASMLIAPFASGHSMDRDEAVASGVAMIADVAASNGGADALALLRAVATLGPQPIAAAARTGSARMRASGIDDAGWSRP